MDIMKRVTLWFGRILLNLQVSAWMSAVVFVILFGTSAPIKQTLAESKIYEKLPDIVVKQSEVVSGEQTTSLDNKIILEIIKNEMSAKKLQTYSENFIDGMYSWLSEKTPRPNFRIDLTGVRDSVAEAIAVRAIERLNTLPPCTRIPTGSLDPFSISCLPPGIDTTKEKRRIKNEVLSNKDFLPNSIITAEHLPKTKDGQDFTVAYKNVPKTFGTLTKLPWILGVTSLLTSAGIVWLTSDKRRGVRTVGKIILVNGTFVFVTTFIFGLLLPNISKNLQANFVGEAAPIMNDVLRSILQSIIKALLISSGILIALGGAILLGERFIKPKQTAEQTTPETAEKITPEPKEKPTN